MAARKEFPVKVRRVAVTNKKTGVKYIEERRYQYDPAKGYNVLLSSRRTGEKILEGETVTTRCRPKKKPAEAAQTAELSCQTNPCRGSGLDSSCRGSGRTRKFGPQGVSQRWNLREAALRLSVLGRYG